MQAEPSLAAQWAALHEAAQVIAAIAGEATPRAADGGNLAEAAARQGGWRKHLIDQQVEDLSVILAHGISALLGEFRAARRGILALCPPGTLGQRRLG